MSFKLNPQQAKAVKHLKGPLLIVAGAGTGKTTVITERIKYLIEKGLAKPSEILALTFTEHATREMEERVDIALPLGYTQTWISTFHGFCERVLRAEAIQIGLSPDFKILSQAESYFFIKNHLFKFNLKYFRPLGNPTKFIAGMVTHFNRLKDENVSPSNYAVWVKNQELKTVSEPIDREEIEKFDEMAKAYQKYEELKRQENVMDFADLISNTLELFRKRPSILNKYQEQFKYILIDEFQDTNHAQNHLAVILTDKNQNITVVADDNQAIYRFRGAAVYNVLDFKKHFPQAEIVTLVQNYRSRQNILDRAYQLIQHNNPDTLEVKEGIDKKLIAQTAFRLKDPQPVRVIFEDQVENEAERVVTEIAKLIKASNSAGPETAPTRFNYQPKDIAILVRANNHAQPFLRALTRHGIPHQFLGPGKLYQKPEIKDLISYLKLLDNFSNDTAVYRVLVMPQLGIDRRDIAALVNFAKRYNLSLFEAMEFLTEQGLNLQDFKHFKNLEGLRVSAETKKRLTRLVKIVHRHLKLLPNESPGQILYYFTKDIGLLQKLANPQSEVEQHQALNISKLFDKIKAYEAHTPEARVKNFVEYIDFMMNAGESPLAAEVDWVKENAVNIITIHSAKGLEFPIVFLVNLVNDRFPTRNRSDQIPMPEDLTHEPLPEGSVHEQEERRLFYVGLTRAKQKLYLTGAKFYGEGKRPKKLSPFVYEALGEDLTPYLLKSNTEKQSALLGWADAKKSLHVSPPISSTKFPVSYLSYSQLNTFKVCPLHYKLKFILKVPTLPSAAVSFGRTLHETLKEFYQSLPEPKDKDQPMAELLEKLLASYEKHWISEGYAGKQHEQERKKQGEKYLRIFLNKFFDPKIKTLALEEPFNFTLGGLKIGGRIDRIDKLQGGAIEIIDYKSGQVPNDKTLQKNLQLSIYALAASQVPARWQRNPEKIKVSYYYLEQGEKKTLARTPADLEKAAAKILDIRDQIENSHFECSGNPICKKNCEYALFCNTQHNSL